MEKWLNEGAFLDLRVKDGMVLAARGGRFWLTRAADPKDYLLGEGEALSLPRGQWLVQALGSGTVVWTDGPIPQKIVFGRPEVETSHLPSVSGI